LIFVIRDGVLVPKNSIREAIADARSDLPMPQISRMDPFESPVTGKEITSWGERDRDMKAADAYDPRDVSTPYSKGRDALKGPTDG
jgi:hypothetical protein